MVGAGGCTAISPPPPTLKLAPFYTRFVDAGGIPIVSSAQVPDAALSAARDIARGMLQHRPDLRAALVRDGYRIAIMGEDEGTLDLPEQAHWTRPSINDPRLTRCERIHYAERIGSLTDREYWDRRARGMAGLLTSGAAEDLLGRRTSRYYGETIFIHEFSHDILAAAQQADPALYAELEQAYAAAVAKGLWKDEYAATNADEYWAEGTQFWFDSNRLAVFGGRRILNHTDLAAYDPRLYAALGRVYGTTHHLKADPFWMSPARVPPGPVPLNTAEQC
jgi:hypothetical protein